MPSHAPFPYKDQLELPVIGLEAEFKVFVDEKERTPEEVWRTPAAFIEGPTLKRANKSLQLPTGGALYFDGGVIEVVTPVIEIAPQCTGRAVRSLWEQIGFVRDQLTNWEKGHGHRVRLEAFSCHVNISFELSRGERSRDRTVQKLAMLLIHLLPVPVIVAGANRRSTGIGVRPRRERIELTMDFTPDPGLMAATVALIVGVVREVITWPSYRLDALGGRGVPILAGAEPGKHPSRNGWVMRDFHFPRNPFQSDIDERIWPLTDSRILSLREIAFETVMVFRDAIRRVSDPFSYRLLLSVMRGETPSLLDLDDRPAAYADVGRATRWGTVLPELENFAALMRDEDTSAQVLRRRTDLDEKLAPPWSGEPADRRVRGRDHERRQSVSLAPSKRLTRSAYEKVFLKLVGGGSLRIGGERLTPVKVQGWYHSIFRNQRGEERMLSIDQLLAHLGSWE
ncbi:MAG TPA: hypothetical protein VHX14_01890 [Thermoanaerobaculia bacterium]|jgi:hypothetical protein|nr:hypothetical protein [Thermoanaerobaculia bacterium]